MDSAKFFTAQIELNEKEPGTDRNTVMEFKDMTWDQKEQFKSKAFVQGVQRQTAPGTYELIDPLRIHRIYIIQQPHKYGL